MTEDKVTPFPALGEWTVEQQEADLLDLYERLTEHLAQDKPFNGEPFALSIDDVMQLCELIEERLGPAYFADE